MPSAKRERIRANQQRLKEQQLAVARRKKNVKRLAIAVVVAAVVLGAIYLLTRPQAPAAKSAKSKTSASPAVLANGCPNPDGSAPRRTSFKHYPPQCLNPAYHYTAVVTTTAGTFDITLEPKLGPKSANNFYVLSLYHFFRGTTFFRVIPGFVIQGGSPSNNDYGTPGYSFADKTPPAGSYRIGTVAMANSGAPGTNGSQFFIISGPSGVQLPSSYTIFGQVSKGLPVITKINDGGNAANNGIPPVHTYKIESVKILVSK